MIGRGCIYEQSKSCFALDGVDIEQLTHKDSRKLDTRNSRYMKKFAAGKIIGLHNLIPVFQEKVEIVHFTDKSMVAELHEINIAELRRVINSNGKNIKALWDQLLPKALLLLFE